MRDEVDLPRLRPSTPPCTARPSYLRKRSRRSSNSSDVPIFSSDDLAEASCENYVSPRRKKQHRRPWWADDDAESRSRMRRRRGGSSKFKDSGVWLSSDGSTDDGFSADSLHIKKPVIDETQSPGGKPAVLTPEAHAQTVIQECLELGRETIDLSSCGIINLSNDLIRPLQHLIRQPNVDSRTENAYHSFQPSIQLFLASNQLFRLPSEIFNLRNISVLSLRNTRISFLPPTIGNLVNLRELNVAGNELRFLPREIVDLMSHGKLTMITAWPNPFFRFSPSSFTGKCWEFPEDMDSSQHWAEFFAKELLEFRNSEVYPTADSLYMAHVCKIYRILADRAAQLSKNTRPTHIGSMRTNMNILHDPYIQNVEQNLNGWKTPPIFISRTEAALFTMHGSPTRSSEAAPSSLPSISTIPPAIYADQILSLVDEPEKRVGVRSLFELALEACTSSPFFEDLKCFLPSDAPETIECALDLAYSANTEGGRICSSCKRRFIVPRAEWIEYWHISRRDSNFCLNEELFLPFLSRGCSWKCKPDAIR